MPVKLRILLPAPEYSGRVFGGSTLDGYVAVSSDSRGHLGQHDDSPAYLLEVIFEGELLNAISLVPAAVVLQRQKRLRFLRVTQTILVSGSSIQQSSLIPFHFDIPNNAYGLDRDFYIGDREETLPPSLSLISDHIHTRNDMFVRGVCDISYRVRARIITRAGKYAGEAARPVTFVPTHPRPLPPLCATDFASEFALACSQKTNGFSFLQSQSNYQLSIHTDEPYPLVFGGDKKAFTTIYLQLRYTPTTHESQYTKCPRPPSEMFFDVQSTLQAATFLSVAPQTTLPKQGDVEPSTLIMKKTTVGATQARKLRFSSWRLIDEQFGSPNSGWESTAALIFAYDGLDPPVPTFACTYASRRYALAMQLRMEGSRSAKFHLRVPVQITYQATGDEGSLASEVEATPGISLDPRCMPPIYTE